MDTSALDDLQRMSCNHQNWESGPIIITVASSLQDDSPKEINLSSTIGFNSTAQKSDSRFFLQNRYNKNNKDSRLTLSSLFTKACANSGIQIRMKGWEQRRQCIRFCCFRSRKYEPGPEGSADTSKTKKRYNSSTQRPTGSDDTCKFGFHVHWDESLSRWYIKQFGGGCAMHTGHYRKDPETVQRPLRDVGEHEHSYVLLPPVAIQVGL